MFKARQSSSGEVNAFFGARQVVNRIAARDESRGISTSIVYSLPLLLLILTIYEYSVVIPNIAKYFCRPTVESARLGSQDDHPSPRAPLLRPRRVALCILPPISTLSRPAEQICVT